MTKPCTQTISITISHSPSLPYPYTLFPVITKRLTLKINKVFSVEKFQWLEVVVVTWHGKISFHPTSCVIIQNTSDVVWMSLPHTSSPADFCRLTRRQSDFRKLTALMSGCGSSPISIKIWPDILTVKCICKILKWCFLDLTLKTLWFKSCGQNNLNLKLFSLCCRFKTTYTNISKL